MPTETDLSGQLAKSQAKVAELEGKLAQVEANLQIFIRQSPVAIALFDNEMNYILVSEKYLDDYRVKTNIIGKNHYEVFPDVPQRWKEVHQRCLLGVEESCTEDTFTFPDGSLLYMDWVVKPWYKRPKEVGGLILIAEKVNERVEDKQKLLRLNRELKQSNQKLEEFAYAVSHHLQEPLKSATIDAEIVRDYLLKSENHPVQESANFFLTHMRRMQKMIGGLLEFARLGKQKGFHEVEIEQIIATVLDNLKHKIAVKKVKIWSGAFPSIRANEFELIALFQNLIANGIKYNESIPIEIFIGVERNGDFWEFFVRDNGIGIPPENQAEIFHLFRRLELDQQYEGTGIGLPICKRIVESMGGEIWLKSQTGEGTTIYFTLPASV